MAIEAPPVSQAGRSVGTLGLLPLIGVVVGAMIGAGVFGLPRDMAGHNAGPNALILGWLITGVGMICLAMVFQYLAIHAQDPNGGLYGYARYGFGSMVGTLAAWGYWISAWLGNLAYFVAIGEALSRVWPAFGDGTTWTSVLVGSVILWIYVALLMVGVRESAWLNAVITVAKFLPLLVFVVLAIAYFNPALFGADMGATQAITIKTDDADKVVPAMPMLDQVKSMMLVTVWAFLGIEGAAVFTRRAKKAADVGRATLIGLLVVLGLYIAINLLSNGIMSRGELGSLTQPTLAGILEKAVGPWGFTLIWVGFLVSLSGAMLSWMLLASEVLSSTGRAGGMPRIFGRESGRGTPIVAVILTALVLQVALIWVHFAGQNYGDVILMSGAMMLVPYFLAAGYAVKRIFAGHGSKTKAYVIAIGALAYAVWLLYAADWPFLLTTGAFYLVGLAVHVWNRMEKGEPIVRGIGEGMVAAGVLLVGIIGAAGTISGWLNVQNPPVAPDWFGGLYAIVAIALVPVLVFLFAREAKKGREVSAS